MMDLDTALQGVQKILSTYKDIRKIRFFGGEPLLNVPVLKGICEYITDELGITDMSYCVETNGTLLDEEILDVLLAYHIEINISFDGPQSLHDNHRIFKNGEGTYSSIVKTMNLLKKHNVRFGIQCTFTNEHNSISPSELFEELAQYTPYVRVACCLYKDGTKTEMSFKDYILEPINYLVEDEPQIYNLTSIQNFSSLLNERNDLECCGAHHKITIFPDGNVYPCELVAGDEYWMGNVQDADFPGERFDFVKNKLEMYNRDTVLNGYWFRYLINPCCVADLLEKKYQKGEILHLHPRVEKFYEDMILKIYDLYSSGQWDRLIENTTKYFRNVRP